jgi:hypothetical protein
VSETFLPRVIWGLPGEMAVRFCHEKQIEQQLTFSYCDVFSL